MEVDPKIMLKVVAREQKDRDLNRCLKVSICPKCGHDLTKYQATNGSTVFRCLSSSCKFDHPM